MEYKVLKTDGKAKRAEMKTVHGTIQTPVFMSVPLPPSKVLFRRTICVR